MDDPKFTTSFTVTTTPYKTHHNQPIPLYVLIPKTLAPGPRPLIIKYHGGFLVTGHALFPDWSAQWLLSYALHHNALIIAINHRLFPESNGKEILSDIKDALSWIKNSLPAYLRDIGSSATVNYDQVIAYGESAGGYLAIQTGLMEKTFIKAVIAAYPMTYIDSPWYCEASTTKSPNGAPQVGRGPLDTHLASLSPDTICTSAMPPSRMALALSILQSGGFTELGDEEELFPAKVLEKVEEGAAGPFLFIFSGTEDRAVPCEETRRFAGAWEDKFGKERVVGRFVEGGDHGFDSEATLETGWLKEGLDEVTRVWLG